MKEKNNKHIDDLQEEELPTITIVHSDDTDDFSHGMNREHTSASSDGQTLLMSDADSSETRQVSKRKYRFIKIALCVLGLLLLLASFLIGYDFYRRRIALSVPVTYSDGENIRRLDGYDNADRHGDWFEIRNYAPLPKPTPSVMVSTDSILGVPFDMYKLVGLRAELTMECPSPDDKDVYLYTRSADYRADNKQILGDCVIAGKRVASGVNPQGYVAAIDNNIVLSATKSDDVIEHVMDRNGYFFRQIMLVSAGERPDNFLLKGKVERRALAYNLMGDENWYYIATHKKESLYDLAEALIEYGFSEAIYLTGGDGYYYYRDDKGEAQWFGNPDMRERDNEKGLIMYLVFKPYK